MSQADDFAAFEKDVADVANPYDELPGVPVSLDMVEHLAELVAHFLGHVEPHIYLALASGHDSVVYPVKGGAQLKVSVSELSVLIDYSIPPDVAANMRQLMMRTEEEEE